MSSSSRAVQQLRRLYSRLWKRTRTGARHRPAGHRASLSGRRPLLEPLESRTLLDAGGFDFPGRNPVTLHTESVSWVQTAADVDGDGLVDLIAAHWGARSISVARNLGDGTFAAPVSYAAGNDPYAVIAADVDGDGAVDLVTAGYSGCAVSVLRNLGDGTFAAPVCYLVGSPGCSVTAADVDGDGAIDLISTGYSDSVSVLRNLGDGTFAEPVSYAAGPAAYHVTAADLDGDGAIDLITTGSSHSVSVLRNLGDGTFAAPVSYTVGRLPMSLTAADLDGDGAVDLVMVTPDEFGTVSVLRNLGNGTFADPICYAAGRSSESLMVTDLDGDGAVDLVTLNHPLNKVVEDQYHGLSVVSISLVSVSVFRNRGDGTFTEPVSYTWAGSNGAATALDVDQDGAVDLVSVNGDRVSVLRNSGDGRFVAEMFVAVDDAPLAVTAVDVDGDGASDLVTANDKGTVSVFRNRGDGTFAAQVTYAVGIYPHQIVAADVDRDGAVDLVVATNEGVVLLRNQGNGTFVKATMYDERYAPDSVAAGDLDGDGAVDVVLVDAIGVVSVLRNLGDGTFAAPVSYVLGTHSDSLTLADVDGNGAVDLIAATHIPIVSEPVTWEFVQGVPIYIGDVPPIVVQPITDPLPTIFPSGSVLVLRNRGDGTFADPVAYDVDGFAEVVTAADVDGDGAVDLVTANSCSHTVSVLRNRGDGTFADGVNYRVEGDPLALVAVDIDQDGAIDLVTANLASGTVCVLRNWGDGSFADPVTFRVDGDPHSVTAADFDGDGAIDLVTANLRSNSVSVLRNLSSSPRQPAVTTTVIVAPASDSVYGEAVTFTVTVGRDDPSAGTPTGLVQFVLDGSTYGEAVALSQGTATLVLSGLAIGNHTLEAVYLSDCAEVQDSQAQRVFHVAPAPLTITVDNPSKTYGQANPELTLSYSGFVNGDTPACLSQLPTLATSATAGSHVGDYAITASGAASSNYTITYVSGTLSVTPAALTIQADNKSGTVGLPLPTLTASYLGLVNGDTSTCLTVLPTLATSATEASPAGSYAITASGAVSADYTIRYVDGTLTLLPPQNMAVLTDDPLSPGKTLLSVYGTSRNDVEQIVPGSRNGDVWVLINGRSQGRFSPTGRIVVHGLAGNDQLHVLDRVTVPTWLYGDEGNDLLWGGSGPTLLVGGAGNDVLRTGKGRSLVSFETGKDSLRPGAGEVVLLSGPRAAELNDQALEALLSEWSSSAGYATRVGHLVAKLGTRQGVFFLRGATV